MMDMTDDDDKEQLYIAAALCSLIGLLARGGSNDVTKNVKSAREYADEFIKQIVGEEP